MSMRKVNYQKIMELLSYILHCPVCNNKYTAAQTNIIDAEDAERYEHSSMLVHTDCERCKSSVVFNISLEGPEIFSVGMVTDLTSEDARKFRDQKPIALDEVIEFHNFIRRFDGNFEQSLR